MKKVIVGVISGIVGLAGGIAISNKRVAALKKNIKKEFLIRYNLQRSREEFENSLKKLKEEEGCYTWKDTF